MAAGNGEWRQVVAEAAAMAGNGRRRGGWRYQAVVNGGVGQLGRRRKKQRQQTSVRITPCTAGKAANAQKKCAGGRARLRIIMRKALRSAAAGKTTPSGSSNYMQTAKILNRRKQMRLNSFLFAYSKFCNLPHYTAAMLLLYV